MVQIEIFSSPASNLLLPIRISNRKHVDIISVEHAVADILVLDQLAHEVHDGGGTDPLTGVNSSIDPVQDQ